jgi:AraC-like DNA-binding protein
METRIPIIYVRELADFLGESGVNYADLIRKLEVPASLLADQEATVSRFEIHHILARAAAMSPPGFALRFGHRMRPGHHGLLGQAMMCARTLRESLKTLERFASTRGIPAAYRLVESEVGGELRFDLTTPVGRLRTQYLEWALMIALSPSLQHSRPGEAAPQRVRLAFPRPGYAALYKQLVPCPVEFDATHNLVSYDRHALDTALVNSNAAVLEFCERRCELILADLQSAADVSSRVRNELLAGLPPFPDAERTARALHMSSRALRRRLRAEGTSFRALVQQVRRQLAYRYLQQRELTVDEVARLLGYSESAAFSRAFKAWTGQNPTEFRGSASV